MNTHALIQKTLGPVAVRCSGFVTSTVNCPAQPALSAAAVKHGEVTEPEASSLACIGPVQRAERLKG